MTTQQETLERLRQRMNRGLSRPPSRFFSSGYPLLDRLLPGGGFSRGSLVEWFSKQAGNGVGSLALQVAVQACGAQTRLVVVDPEGWFYPPAAAAIGVELQRLVVLRPPAGSGTLWAIDQALRCRAVGAVWSYLDRLNDRWFRRFQLAAEQSGSLGLFLRPARERGLPSWSALQFQVESAVTADRPDSVTADAERQVCVELVRCRGQSPLGRVTLQLTALENRGAGLP